MRNVIAIYLAGAALASCASEPAPVETAFETVPVFARGETEPVGTANADAADDPAIWHNPEDPAASLFVGTDKKAGLHVYGLDGKSRSFVADGLLNNVDMVVTADNGVIVAASDRNDPENAKLRLYRLDTAAATLEPLGAVDGGTGEAYGLCMTQDAGGIIAYSALKDGTVAEFRIDLSQEEPRSLPLRTIKIPTQIEGCVVDTRSGTLYVGEEEAGIWRIPTGATEGELVFAIDDKLLVADVEGLAMLPEGEDGGVLVASSQGDNAYAVFSLPGMEPLGRFRIAADALGSTEETDGIALMGGSFGPDYPEGLFIAQDGQNEPEAQNFKLVSWADVKAALSLP